jgi:hypothetical protein
MSDRGALGVDRHRAVGDPGTQIHAHWAARIAIHVGKFSVRGAGLLIFATMAVLEPFVRFILMTLASLGMFVSIVFGFLLGAEGFPKWLMLGMSVGCFLALGAYYWVMSILGNVSDTRES